MVRSTLVLLFAIATAAAAWAQQPIPEISGTHRIHLERFTSFPARPAPSRSSLDILTQIDGSFWNEAWEQTQRTTHAYDGSLRTVSTYYTADLSRSLDPIGRTVQSYDAQQRLIERRDETWTGIAFSPSTRDVLTYSGNGFLPTLVVTQGNDGDAWTNIERITFTLNATGTFYSEGRMDSWTGSAWAPVSRFVLEEVAGDVVYTDQTWNGSAWENTERSTYFGYTLEALVTEFEAFTAIAEDYVGLFLIAAVAPDGLFETWTGAAWQPESRQVTVRYIDGNTLLRAEKTVQVWTGATWEAEARTAVTYAPGERPVLVELQTPVDQLEWISMLVDAYTYTEQGRIARAEQSFVLDLEWETAGETPLLPIALYEFTWQQAGTSTDDTPSRPNALVLEAPFPNPATGSAALTLHLREARSVTLRIYDALGRQVAIVAEQALPAGRHMLPVEAASLPPGRYFVRLESGDLSAVRTLTVVR